jgi:Kef-type K+ transport system membrane component KefB
MTLSTVQVAQLLTTTAVVILAAHALGYLFAKLRQPAVIGEIVAGLLLGPTLLGLVAPQLKAGLFPATGPTSVALGTLGQFGLLLLMFVTGGEMQLRPGERERRTVGMIAVAGLILPFVCGALFVQLLDYRHFSGPSGSLITFTLIFGIAVAVTSIPVISRIMLDLGLLHTPFARVVLSVAAVEDVVLYVVLAVVLSLAHKSPTDDYGLWALIGSDSTALSVIYHVLVTLVFFAFLLTSGHRVFRWLLLSRINVVARRSPVAARVAWLLGAVLLCTVLGINPIFGALLAGLALRRGEPPRTAAAVGTIRSTGAESSISASSWQAWDTLRQFSLAFFIPIYFFTVGLKLDLIHNFEVRFFLCFFVLSCGLKASSIWFGAKLAGQPSGRAWDLAVALNARGGPGIVLATVTFQAGIINDSFFTSIVLLSVVTSQLAGFWLDRRFAAVVTDAVSAQTAHETPGQPDQEAIALPSNTLTGSERVQDADRPDVPERA